MSMRATGSALRPRLWVPGVLWVSDELELLTGRDVGYNGWGKPFGLSAVGHFQSLTDFRHSAWLVERAALSDELIDEHAIILAERLLDPDQQPHARRWLREQPLVCVSGAKVARLVDAGLRVYRVEHGVQGEDVLVAEAQGADRAAWRLRGRVRDFWPVALRERDVETANGLPAPEEKAVRTAVDRVLRAVSRGVLSEIAVVNALAARILVEPGYGYRGATDGTAASIERVQREVRALDVLFRQIFERAESQRKDALAVADALEQPGDKDEIIAVPVYERASRLRLPELRVALGEEPGGEGPSWLLDGRPRAELVLPELSRWRVERVDRWSPELPAELAGELEREQRRGCRPPSAMLAVMMMALLAMMVMVALWRLA